MDSTATKSASATVSGVMGQVVEEGIKYPHSAMHSSTPTDRDSLVEQAIAEGTHYLAESQVDQGAMGKVNKGLSKVIELGGTAMGEGTAARDVRKTAQTLAVESINAAVAGRHEHNSLERVIGAAHPSVVGGGVDGAAPLVFQPAAAATTREDGTPPRSKGSYAYGAGGQLALH